MKSFQEFQEALSMDDLKMIKGGTDAQRKIAQDRQKAREAKNKGFGKKPDVRKSQLGKWSQGIKNAPKKALPPAKDSSAIVKSPSSAVAKKEKPGALAKTGDTSAEKEHRQKSASGSAGEPKRDTTYRSGLEDKKKKKGNSLKKAIKAVGGAAKKVGGAAKGAVKGVAKAAASEFKNTRTTDVTTSGDLEGLSGRNKGLIG